MPWTPNPRNPAPVFTTPIIDNALAIVERDFGEALSYYGFTGYIDFQERSRGMVKGNVYPCLAVTPGDVNTEQAADNSHTLVSADFDSYIGVVGKDDEEVSTLIQNYVGVLDAVYRTAEYELVTGISNPFEVWANLRHEYGPRGSDETTIFRAALVRTTVNFRQR